MFGKIQHIPTITIQIIKHGVGGKITISTNPKDIIMPSFKKKEVPANIKYITHKPTVSGRFSASNPNISNPPRANKFAAGRQSLGSYSL